MNHSVSIRIPMLSFQISPITLGTPKLNIPQHIPIDLASPFS
jgi:hypothetical protein